MILSSKEDKIHFVVFWGQNEDHFTAAKARISDKQGKVHSLF